MKGFLWWCAGCTLVLVGIVATFTAIGYGVAGVLTLISPSGGMSTGAVIDLGIERLASAGGLAFGARLSFAGARKIAERRT
ncbi:MAG: hypothetical protein ACD_81C00025G0002 [uncultured bacterium]|nr:MAG: hypothetical protein ACD_81C00025G0002 [uncultured bacterium]HBI26089.1 hypothetical protein [Candidatus Wolfebacteria bacterium]